jgi:lipoprotein NlpI
MEHALRQAHAPSDADCARSLGAGSYASLYVELARARAYRGDFLGAAEAYRSAHACRPRAAGFLASLADVLFKARDFEGSREAINRALSIDPRWVHAHRIAGNLDFVAERWADAVARFRYVAASDTDRVDAGYGQIMFWLAQQRAGVPDPKFILRRPNNGWPQPLLKYLSGELTEEKLADAVREGDGDYDGDRHTGTDERLCEALYYVGQAHWARGDPRTARDYFAAAVNVKVLYAVEHGLSLAEIAKLRVD